MTHTNAAPIVDAEHPWLGLNAYTEATQAYFFGRDAEIREMYTRVRENPLTILYGQSGLGKSSLLGAGLIPKFKIERYRPVLLRLDFADSAPSLLEQTRSALCSALCSPLEKGGQGGFYQQPQQVPKIPPNPPLPKGGNEPAAAELWEILHHSASLLADFAQCPPVLIFDQFEEIFTLGIKRANEVNAWFQQIADWIENRPPAALQERFRQDRQLARQFDSAASPARLVITLREDYLSHLERWKHLLPSLMRNRMALHQLSGPQALLAAVKPGQRGVQAIVSEDVGAQIVRKVAQRPDDTPLETIEAVPPFLSLLCEQLNAARLQADQAQIGAELVADYGDDILDVYYADSFAGQHPALRRFVEDKLVSGGGHRSPITREDAENELRSAGISEPAAALDALVARRLLTVEARGGVHWLELTHDILAPRVVRIRTTRQEQEARQETKQQKQRQQCIVIALVTLVLLLGGLAGFGWYSYQRAERALTEAENLARVMIFDLPDRLEPLDQLPLMDFIITQVEMYHQHMGNAASAMVRHQLGAHYTTQGDALLNQGDLNTALQRYQTGLATMRNLAMQEPNDSFWQQELAISLEKVGNVQIAQRDLTAALLSYRERKEIWRKLAAQDPSNANWQQDLAASYGKIAGLLLKQGNAGQAQEHLRNAFNALATAEALIKASPTPSLWNRLSWSRLQFGQFQQAKQAALEGLKLAPDFIALQENLASSHLFLGETEEAEAIHRRYKDQRIADGWTWRQAVAHDFAIFRQLGMDRPQMKAIEALLGLDKPKPD